MYLSKINAENSTITIGTPVLNRTNAIEKNIMGMFVSTMPITINVENEESILQLARRVATKNYNMFRHQRYSYNDILKFVRDKHNLNGNMYEVMYSFQNATTNTDSYTKWFTNGYSEVSLVIHIDNRDSANAYTVTIDYQTQVFGSEEEVALIFSRIECIILQMVQNMNLQVADVNIIPEYEQRKILLEFNDTEVEFEREKGIHELFVEQATKTPDKTALIFEDKKFTYQQLYEISNGLALSLLKLGIVKGDKVAVLLDRDEKVIIAQLAILKLGAVFIPIDSRYPKERVDYILEESRAKVIVKNIHNALWFDNACNIEELDIANIQELNVETSSLEEVCYIIFTSGSTGKPKGCTLTNKGLVNFCVNNNILDYCNKLERQICVSVNTISFDFFIAESLLPLLNGYTIVMANEQESTSQNLFRELVIRNKVNIVQTTPTRYKIFFDEKADVSYTKNFDVIVSSGEALSIELLKLFKKYTTAKLYNPLGPSECSVWSVGGELKALGAGELCADDITIGKPIANTQIYILDKDQKLMPIGVTGELCIAGDGVGKGYLNRQELTKERFVLNMFATEDNGHGKVMYHTGDLARWRADGNIEYLGRMDTQVKIRGLRIELGEIENVMNSFNSIRMAVVSDKKDESGRQYLVGYYTTDMYIDEKELRKHLSSKLPKYMVPNFFIKLNEMPLTSSGKIDRKSLPAPNYVTSKIEYEAPTTDKEKCLCNILSKLFGGQLISVNEDFFDMGGDSLRAIEYVAKAHDCGIDISLQNVFDYPTVKLLGDFLESRVREHLQYSAQDFVKYQVILDNNVIDETYIPQKKALGNVLLTGATGFLGAHILDVLMKEEVGKIYCLVRSNAIDDRRGKICNILKYYFGDVYDNEFGNRIIPIVGDIEEEMLSVHMPNDVDTIIHTAASVKHYGSYEYFNRVNVIGTYNVVNYAKKINARMIHISTLSVSGNSLVEEFDGYRSMKEKYFYETSLFIDQPLDNVYIHSKFEAERVVLDAILCGLDAKIIRVGNLTNRKSDYIFQPNYVENAFLTRIKAIVEFGLFPEHLMSLYTEFSPVDLTAEGVVKIAQYADNQSVFHLNNNNPICFKQMLELLHQLGIDVRVIGEEAFNESLKKTLKSLDTEYIFKAFQNDMDGQGKLIYDSNIRVMNDFTVWFMRKLGFEWNYTDYEYINGYVEYFRKIGYLSV